MSLPNDPMILFSLINMKLRDSGETLTEFCKANDVDMESVLAKMKAVGYIYDEDKRRFR